MSEAIMRSRENRLTSQLAQASMEKDQYRYQSFQNNDTIRILVLDPGRLEDPLTGALEVVPIDSAGNYEAISYVWADPGPPRCAYEILIRDEDDSEGLLVLRGGSIFAALRQIRFNDKPRRIWADQCCINQDDLAERSQQVQFMNRIYQNASHILVWLGLDTDKEAALAFDLIRQIDNVFPTGPVEGLSSDAESADLERHIRKHRDAIQALTDRVWFKRGWIVQEIGTDTPATIIWGDVTIDWDTLASVCERLKGYHYLRSTLGMTTSDISFLFRRFIEPDKNTHHANRFNFIYELQRSRHLRFSDDRDRVFAFLGHFSTHSLPPLGCGPVSIVADYTQTVEQTYINVAVQILRDNPAATCIMLAAVQHPRQSLPSRHSTTVQPEKNLKDWLRDEHKLPSWVPDWRWSEGIILAEPICPYSAHGDSAAKVEIVQSDDLILQVYGVEIDTIEAFSRPLLSSDFYDRRAPGQPPIMIERLWHEICMKGSFNLIDKYLGDQTAFYAFMQTLSNGCVQAAGHASKTYDMIPDSVWLQKGARYLLEALGPSDDVSHDVQKMGGGIGHENEYETWSRWATSASDGRVFARATKGYYVLGPAALETGDLVCVLLGCKVPFCLRPLGDRYLFVGECYVHGLMKGEAMVMLAQGGLDERMFSIV